MEKTKEAELEELLSEAQGKLKEAHAFIKRVMQPPFVYGTVINLYQNSVDVSIDGRVMEVNYVDNIRSKLMPGVCVRLNPETFAVVDVRPSKGTGISAIVNEVMNGRVVVSAYGEKHILKTSLNVKQGDRVIVDSSINVIMENLGKKSSQYLMVEMPVAPWSKIGGLEKEIEALKDCVEEPFLYRGLYKKYHKKTPKGVLLYGPPGCGKTLLARAVAYNISERLKKAISNSNGYFIYINGPELLDKYVGETERMIRDIFARARENSKSKSDVTVIFMDEAESLLKRRGHSISTDVYDSIVPQFLSEMDGLNENDGIILLLASNREDIIDPAVLRPGRIDRKLRVGRPGLEATKSIFDIHLSGMPVQNNVVATEIASYAAEELFKGLYHLFSVKFEDIFENQKENYLSMKHFTSGAMIESIAQRAAGIAIKREIKKGKEGLTKDDLKFAMGQEYEETKGIMTPEKDILKDELKQVLPEIYNRVISIDKV